MANKSKFETVVPVVKNYPIPFLIFSYLLLIFSVYILYKSAFNIHSLLPGIYNGTSTAHQVSTLLIGLQLTVIIVFIIGLLSKRVRIMQLAMFLAAIREISLLISLAERSHQTKSVITLIILALIELGLFVYLGALASGHLKNISK